MRRSIGNKRIIKISKNKTITIGLTGGYAKIRNGRLLNWRFKGKILKKSRR